MLKSEIEIIITCTKYPTAGTKKIIAANITDKIPTSKINTRYHFSYSFVTKEIIIRAIPTIKIAIPNNMIIKSIVKLGFETIKTNTTIDIIIIQSPDMNFHNMPHLSSFSLEIELIIRAIPPINNIIAKIRISDKIAMFEKIHVSIDSNIINNPKRILKYLSFFASNVFVEIFKTFFIIFVNYIVDMNI